MRTLSIKLTLHGLSVLPLPIAHFFGAIIGLFLILIPNRSRKVARTNIRLCFPDKSAKEQKQLLRKSLIEMGKVLTESGILWLGNKRRIAHLIKDVRGEALIQEALKQGQGVIFVIPHIGNWEVIGLYCSARYPMTSLYRPPHLAALDQLVRKARQRNGATLVPTNAAGVKALYKTLGENGTTGILPDQDPRQSGGHFAPFFGIQSNTMVLLSRLARKTQAKPLLAYAERLPWGQGFRLHFKEGPEAIGRKDLNASVSAVNALVETAIRHIPEQYQWGYKRFNTRPEGEKDFYSEK